jgi:hypothetical protein
MLGYISNLFKSKEQDNNVKKNYIEELLNIEKDINIKNLVEIFINIINKEEVSNEDIYSGILYIRDYKNGKGLREYGNILLYIYLMSERLNIENISNIKKIIYIYLNEIGRWDDWNLLFEIDYRKDLEFIKDKINKKKNEKALKEKKNIIKSIIIEIICNELINDYKKCKNGKKIGLCAKWCPSEGKRLDKKVKIVYDISIYLLKMIKDDNDFLNILEKDILENIIKSNSKCVYRHILSVLRKKIDIVETHLCQKNIDGLYINRIPKRAILYHKNALMKRGINVSQYIDINNHSEIQSELAHNVNEDGFEYIKENSVYIKKNYLEIYQKYL